MEEQEKYVVKDELAMELYKSLALAQGTFPAIPRDKTVSVTMKSGGKYSFAYAPLETILAAVRKPLADNGLSIVQTIIDGCVVTILNHASGYSLTLAPVKIQQIDAGPQALGSALTYSRRYSLTLALGIAADDDDDANAAEGNKTQQTKQKPLHKESQKKTELPLADPSSSNSNSLNYGQSILYHVTQNIASVKIRLYTDKKTGKHRERYIIADGNKIEYGAFDKKVADAAKKAMEAGIRAELGYKQSKYGFDLVTIALIDIPPDRTVKTCTVPIPVCPEDEKLPASIFLCASCSKEETCPVAKEITQNA